MNDTIEKIFLTDALKEDLLNAVVIKNAGEFLNQLEPLFNQYKIEESFLTKLAEEASKLGRSSIVQYINTLSPNSIIEGSLAQKLLSCPNAENIEKLNILDFFSIKKINPRPSSKINQMVPIVKLILAAKFNHSETLKNQIQIPIFILNNFKNELAQLINIIRIKKNPFKTIFTIADFHWVTCYLEKNEEHGTKLFIFDPEGNDEYLSISENFSHKLKEQIVKIYISSIKIQHGINYCQDFAVDTLLHLLSHHQNIFDYLENPKHILSVNVLSNTKHEKIEVIPPPFLIRTKQKLNTTHEENPGLKLIEEEIYSKEEIRNSINKKGISFWSTIDPYIKDKQNKRIEYKLDKALNLLIIYLINNLWDKTQSEKEKFSFRSF